MICVLRSNFILYIYIYIYIYIYRRDGEREKKKRKKLKINFIGSFDSNNSTKLNSFSTFFF
ncbi:hypothetical protein K7X86_00295, partial [Candidatus Sulcia muelleri]|nr:hypothetical protein [Candidatus Karelsulcia muelleri]